MIVEKQLIDTITGSRYFVANEWTLYASLGYGYWHPTLNQFAIRWGSFVDLTKKVAGIKLGRGSKVPQLQGDSSAATFLASAIPGSIVIEEDKAPLHACLS